MTNPYEHVSKGEELCQKGRVRNAEKAYKKGIQAYRIEGDKDGVAFALGRLGNCYAENGEMDKAVKVLREAISLETDIPAIYYALIEILIEHGNYDEAFAAADRWQKYGSRHIHGPAHEIFINLGNRLIRQKRYEEAIIVLKRAATAMPLKEYTNEYWRVVGSLGYGYEKSGDMDQAMKIFSEAIESGSNDKNSYTRYLMFLERQKSFEEATSIVEKGLKVQLDAAWEADLKKRRQRIENKADKSKRKKSSEVIPQFSIRVGENNTTLRHQIKHSPMIRDMVLGDRIAYVTTGGKYPKLTAWNIANATQKWQEPMPEAPNGISLTDSSIVTYVKKGRVGEGLTIIQFRDLSGKVLGERHLPDAPTEIISLKSRVYVGCRDGNLYSFTASGEECWKFSVPGSKNWKESPYFRPCPYYLRATDELIVFSNFSDIYALNVRGKQIWHWSVPEHKSRHTSGHIAITISTGPPSIGSLAMSEDDEVIASTNETIFKVSQGRIKAKVRLKDQNFGVIEVDSSGRLWAVASTGDKVYLIHDQKLIGSFKSPHTSSLSLHEKEGRILGWSKNDLSIALLDGKLLSHIEFVKNVSNVYCLDQDTVVIAAGHLIVLDVKGEQPEAIRKANKQSVRDPISTLKGKKGKENGIPIRWFIGEKITSISGKAKYKNHDGNPVTIEQLAIDFYEKLDYVGYWSENEYWWAVMALLFWDIIFTRLPGVFTPGFDFPSQFQDMPQDFFSANFYQRRKELIKKRVKELSKPSLFGLKKPDIESEIRGSFRRNRNTPCRPMNWERYSDEEALLMASRVLPDEQLMLIMHHLIKNFKENRSGLPDLFLAKNGLPIFVEVKSEFEKVATHQFAWLYFLRDSVGVPVEICRIASLSN